MKVLVCGSVGYGGIERIEEIQNFLKQNGIEVIDQFKGTNFVSVKDFKGKEKLARKIVENDLRKCKEADLIVLIAEKPSFGTGIEAYFSHFKGKPIIAFSSTEVSSPWPIHFSEKTVGNKKSLLEAIKSFEEK